MSPARQPLHLLKQQNMMLSIFSIFLLCLFFLPVPSAQATQKNISQAPKWSIITGYGSSYPGWGKTEERVETLDLGLRRKVLVKENMGSSWYRGYHSLFMELNYHHLLDYNDTPMVAGAFLAAYTFTASTWKPYVFAGGGPVYVGASIPGMGSHLNGNYQAGIGIHLNQNTLPGTFVEIRYHHISNGNTSDPNDPLNSAKFLLGVSF